MQQMFLKVNIAAYAHLMSLLYAESVSVRPAAAVCTDPNNAERHLARSL